MPDDISAILSQYGGAVAAPSDIDAAVAKYGGQVSSAVPGMEQLGGTPPPAGQRPNVNMTPSALGSVGGLVSGAEAATKLGSGIMQDVSTGFGNEAARQTTRAVGMKPSPMLQNTNPAQNVGSAAFNAAEYAAPTGAIGEGSKAIEAASAGTKYATSAKVLGRAILDAVGAGAAGGAQSGTLSGAAKSAAIAGGTSAALGALTAPLTNKQQLAERAERWYQSALKPSTTLDQTERQAIIRTGLREGIKLDPNVVDNVQQRISSLNDQISNEIAARTQAGAVVNPTAVANYTNRAMQRLGTSASQATPEADAAAIQSVRNEFMAQHSTEAPYTMIRPGTEEAAGTYVPEGTGTTQVPQDIPLAEAQQIKQGTYRKLKDSFGEQSTATREGLKDIARGLKDQIVKAFPEISKLNSRESSLLALESQLQRFVGRTGNQNLIGLGTPLAGVAAHAAGAPVAPLMLLKAFMEMPETKSRIAIMLSKAATTPGLGTALTKAVTSTAPAAAAYASTPSRNQ